MKKILLIIFLFSQFSFAYSSEKTKWKESDIKNISHVCTSSIMKGARAGYYKRAKQVGDTNPSPFPENQVKASIAPMCACIADKISTKWSFKQFIEDQGRIFSGYIADAMRGGVCNPKGFVKKIIDKAKEKNKK